MSFRSHLHRPRRSAPAPVSAELLDRYARNLLRCLRRVGLVDELFSSDHLWRNALLWRLLGATPKKAGERDPWPGLPPQRAMVRLRRLAETELESPPAADGLLGRNLVVIGDVLGLSGTERAMLQLAVVAATSDALSQLMSVMPILRRDDWIQLLADTAALPLPAAREALAPSSTLCVSGLIGTMLDGAPSEFEVPISVDTRLVGLSLEENLKPEGVLTQFLRAEPRTELCVDDFGPRRAELEALVRVVEGWKRTRERGLNFLFYGTTGVGKTEAARLAAALSGCELFLAVSPARTHDSSSPRQRLGSLVVGNTLLKQGSAMLLFDELEDLTPSPFSHFGGSSPHDAPPSKLWMNRLLESNAVPTVWTTNSLQSVDPAFLRRFALAVEFPPLSDRQRRGVWQRIAGAALPAAELDALSVHELSPGEIAQSVKTAKVAGGESLDRETLRLSLEGAERVRGGRPRSAGRVGSEYRLEALNASRDLVTLSDRLASWRPGPRAGMTVCLFGRSGTGKSEYVHYLARRMDRPLLVRNVSDLKSKWVGETERNISAAFQQAQREGALLLFDEADTFLADRRGAQHEWERSQANEFLQQLEACRGFVAVTTNLYKGLDPAVLRRFLFKVEFFPLRAEQRLTLFEAHLGRYLEAPLEGPARGRVEASLRAMGELVPSDFGIVARRLEVLEAKADVGSLLRELEEEVGTRRHDSARPIGFRESSGWGGGGQVAQALAPGQRSENQ